MSDESQFSLLKQRRFLPFFGTQFMGAFNDNVYKNALIIMIAFSAANNSDLLINICAALFILPFFLFSGMAGQIAEMSEKSALIRRIKLAEICIMTLAAIGFYLDNTTLLMAVLFLMGTQSSFFGPVKFAIIPQHLKEEELIGGNGLVEMGTFVSILLGTLAGGLIISIDNFGPVIASVVVITCAVIGYLFSRAIPKAPAAAPDLKFNWNLFSETIATLKITRERKAVFLSVLGISWFWMLGAVYLTQFANFAKLSIGGDETVVTLLLMLFSLGVGIGSMFCEKLSGRMVELGLVPFGSIGLSLFGIDLYFASQEAWQGELRTTWQFIAEFNNYRVMFDLFMIGMFGGFYIVPLYAIIQTRSDPKKRSRVVAGNNILNSLFMIFSAILAIVLLGQGFSIPELFLTMALLNIVVAIYIYTLLPEFLMRFLVWIITSMMYRITRKGLDNIPEEGAAILACNHVSYMDGLIIAGSYRRPVRFVVHKRYYDRPIFNFIYRTAGAIPITSQQQDPQAYEAAFEQIADYIAKGELICIFPEGGLTTSGDMQDFKSGLERILASSPAPVVPMVIGGMWGSLFSMFKGRSNSRPKLRASVQLEAGTPMSADKVSADSLHKAISALQDQQPHK